MKKLLATVFLINLIASLSYSQLKVGTNNYIGVGTDNPLSTLSVGNTGNSAAKVYFENTNISGSSIKTLQVFQPTVTNSLDGWSFGTVSLIGVGTNKHVGLAAASFLGTASNYGMTYGLYSYAGNGQNGYNYGLYSLLKGSHYGAAIFAAAPGRYETNVPGMFAAYLRGNVFVEDYLGIKNTNPQYPLDVTGDINITGTVRYGALFQGSDISIKRDIKDLSTGNLEKIKLLKAVTYKYKVPEDLVSKMSSSVLSDTGRIEEPITIPNPEFYEEEQIGFIAQDLQKIFPELVIQDKDGKLGVNYIGLVPVLVEAIKEQQIEIEQIKALLNEKNNSSELISPKIE